MFQRQHHIWNWCLHFHLYIKLHQYCAYLHFYLMLAIWGCWFYFIIYLSWIHCHKLASLKNYQPNDMSVRHPTKITGAIKWKFIFSSHCASLVLTIQTCSYAFITSIHINDNSSYSNWPWCHNIFLVVP